MPILSNINKENTKKIKALIDKLKKEPSQKSIKEHLIKLIDRQSRSERIHFYLKLALVYKNYSPTESIKIALRVKQIDKKNKLAEEIINECNRKKLSQSESSSDTIDHYKSKQPTTNKIDINKSKDHRSSKFHSKLNTFYDGSTISKNPLSDKKTLDPNLSQLKSNNSSVINNMSEKKSQFDQDDSMSKTVVGAPIVIGRSAKFKDSFKKGDGTPIISSTHSKDQSNTDNIIDNTIEKIY